MELTTDSGLKLKTVNASHLLFFGIDKGDGFDATVEFEYRPELNAEIKSETTGDYEEIKEPKPNPITSSLDGVGEIIGLSLEMREMILDMRKSMYTEKDLKSFTEYCVKEFNLPRIGWVGNEPTKFVIPTIDLLFNEWKSKNVR